MEILYWDKDIETADRETIQSHQLLKLRSLLQHVLGSNRFYQRKLREAGIESPEEVRNLDDLKLLPYTTKKELIDDQAVNPPFGTNLTFPLEQYVKYHQTSGTTGRPYRVLDTRSDWDWWERCWAFVHRGTGVKPGDRLFFAFSFGPFVGFWGAYESARIVGAMAIPGGAMGSLQRLNAIVENQADTLICTPSYALRLAEEARESGIDPAGTSIKRLIHAGEPGASIPSTKRRIEEAWGAKCFDHHGMTEAGAMSFECVLQPGSIHLISAEYVFEAVDPATGEYADEGELVVTNLGRVGFPAIRYRSGDRVKLQRQRCECGRTFSRLEGGINARVDDMLIVRGINVFPSAIENIVREFEAIEEFAVEVCRRREMDELEIKIEVPGGEAAYVADALTLAIQKCLTLRPTVEVVPHNTLPRFDLKARRFFDRRK